MEIKSKLIEAHIFREKKNGIEFLLLKRAENQIYPGLWQMVSGKINENEQAFKTALREIKEETGLIPEKFWVAPNVNSFYSHEGDYISMLPVFAAKVSENASVTISNEHSDYLWAGPEEAKKLLAWPGQRKSVDVITEYFTKEISFLKFVEIML